VKDLFFSVGKMTMGLIALYIPEKSPQRGEGGNILPQKILKCTPSFDFF
jgi:hypothetical protein